MNAFIKFAFIFSLATTSFAHEDEMVLTARSIAEHCQFVYQIETEFKLAVKDLEVTAVKVWLKDLYTDSFLEPQIFAMKSEGSLMFGEIDINTMSTNPKYLAHDLYFSFIRGEVEVSSPDFKAKFSQLMNRCTDRAHRDQALFQSLNIEKISNQLRE